MKKTLTILVVLMAMFTQAQVNKQILQVNDTSKVFGSNKQIGDFISIKTYPKYLFRLNHTVTAMKTVGYALKSGWCDTIGKDRADDSWVQTDGVIKTSTPTLRVSIGDTATTLTSLYVNGDYYIKGGNGDVNNSGTYTAVDALYMKAIVGGFVYPYDYYARADMFGTGLVTPFHANYMQGLVTNPTLPRPPSKTTMFEYNNAKIKGILGSAAYVNPVGSTVPSYINDTIVTSNFGWGYGIISYIGNIATPAMQITNTGNIGINRTIPTEKLDIVGNVKVTGTYSTGTVVKVTIDTVSAIRLTGNSTVWKDVEGAFSTGLNGGNAYPTYVVDSGYYTFTVDTTGPSICKQYFPSIQINHDFKLGATVYPHVHYKYETAKGVPTFIIKYRWKNIGSAPTAWKWCKMNSNTGTTNGTLQLAYSTIGMPATSNNISAILQAEVYLFSQTGTGGINAYSFDLHCEVDSMGSNTDLSKD